MGCTCILQLKGRSLGVSTRVKITKLLYSPHLKGRNKVQDSLGHPNSQLTLGSLGNEETARILRHLSECGR